MKKFLLTVCTLLTVFAGFSQINISTGVASWRVTPTGATANAIAPHSVWNSHQATPIAGTNARWISPTTSYNVTAGVYVFETIIPVSGNPATLNLNFQVAADDIIEALELQNPGGALTPLAVPAVATPKGYALRKATDTTIKCPQRGEWKLKARVKFLDQMGGFILSGYAKTEGNCCDCGKWAGFQYTIQQKDINTMAMASPSKQPKQLNCGATLVIRSGSILKLNPVYSCSAAGCKLSFQTTLLLPNGTTQNIAGPLNSFNQTAPGYYIISVTPYCNGKACPPCRIRIFVTPGCEGEVNTEKGEWESAVLAGEGRG